MNKKRDRLQIIHDILNAIQEKNGEIKPTHILYKSNLSSQMLDGYLGDLIAKNFITPLKTRKGKTYTLNDRGYAYLQKYALIKEFIDSFGLN